MSSNGEKGLISNLQDLAVHDGPGLRVLVFLKGCPLRCKWCQNPESLAPFPEIAYHSYLCVGCRNCFDVCPVPGAIVEDGRQRVDRSKCTRCMKCAASCLGGALRKVGDLMSVDELVKKLVRYKPFFDRSDRGGVTISGGEPSFQSAFVLNLLKGLADNAIHSAIETCGYAVYPTLKELAQNCNLMLIDVKHMDEASHMKGTGISNTLILENIRKLCKEVDTEIVVRIPLIVGFNDDDENVTRTAEFLSSLHRIKHVDLLPFNILPSGKYQAMGVDWEYAHAVQQPPERLARLEQIVRSYGLEATTGGLW